MKLIFKGKFTTYDALPKGEFPENAVAFKEPKTMGGGDFMNMFNAAVQMPLGSLTQLSGMHSYWFMPENNT